MSQQNRHLRKLVYSLLIIHSLIQACLTASFSSKNLKIFCFGDSLTSGSSPPLLESFPYAPHLQNELRKQTDNDDLLVRWKGFPGWTSSDLLLGGGLSMTLDQIQLKTGSHVDLVIIIAGTNDLAYEKDADVIFNNIKKIHQIAHEKSIPTLSFGIPDSSWQQQSVETALLRKDVNHKLYQWSKNNENDSLVHYKPFPIEQFDRSSGFWAPDGLHFSPLGYEHLGTSMAPAVISLLSRLN